MRAGRPIKRGLKEFSMSWLAHRGLLKQKGTPAARAVGTRVNTVSGRALKRPSPKAATGVTKRLSRLLGIDVISELESFSAQVCAVEVSLSKKPS